MNKNDLDNMQSEDPRLRFKAIDRLRHNYAPEVGEALIKQLVVEKSNRVWWLLSLCALPIWLPKFDCTVSELSSWPFSGGQTLRILELSQGHVIHSAKKYIPSWLASAEWEYRFSAFRWLTVGGTMVLAYEAATLLLGELDRSFTVSEEALREYSWMGNFAEIDSRRAELMEFIHVNG